MEPIALEIRRGATYRSPEDNYEEPDHGPVTVEHTTVTEEPKLSDFFAIHRRDGEWFGTDGFPVAVDGDGDDRMAIWFVSWHEPDGLLVEWFVQITREDGEPLPDEWAFRWEADGTEG